MSSHVLSSDWFIFSGFKVKKLLLVDVNVVKK